MPNILTASLPLAFAAALLGAQAGDAQALGLCRFDTSSGSFAGDPPTQAACLLRRVEPLAKLSPAPTTLPPRLAAVVGRELPFDRARLSAVIARRGMGEASLGGRLDAPVSRGGGGSPRAPGARYFVIHDTSTPNFGRAPFPADIDSSDTVNRLSRYHRPDPVAHVFVSRRGETWVGHDFAVPWRATKLEGRVGVPSKGLFLHVELVQPRRVHPHQADGTAPTPGFTAAQYDRLALLYIAASSRVGRGLIPAFHAVVDSGIGGGHDDPQNFDMAAFDAAIGRVLDEIGQR